MPDMSMCRPHCGHRHRFEKLLKRFPEITGRYGVRPNNQSVQARSMVITFAFSKVNA